MHREDDSLYFLFIEPKKEEKLLEPIDDDITRFIEMLLENTTSEDDFCRTKTGISEYSNLENKGSFEEGGAWRGFHMTDCGEVSDNKEYQLFNGMITNSLAAFYLKWYRNSIPKSEWIKYKKLTDDFKEYSINHYPLI